MRGFVNELIERAKRSKILADLLYFFGLSLRKDETILRVGDRKVFVWDAIDVETRECLGIWVSMARHQFLVSKFIRMVLKYCKEFGTEKPLKELVLLTKTKNSVKETQ